MAVKNYHHGDLKVALVKAAERLLKEKGIEALSLRTLAAEVGVSHMAPYAHFKNKTELFQSIAASGFNALAHGMEQVDQSLPADKLILEYGTQYIEFALANAPLYRLMLAQTQVKGPEKAESGGHLSNELRLASNRPYNLLMAAFARLIPDKATVNIRALGAWSMVHGMSALIIDGHMDIPEGMTIKSFLAAAALQTPR